MLITCPNCGTQYDVAAAALGPSGRTVRCEKCGHKWHAGDAQPQPQPAPAPMAAPAGAGSEGRPLDELRQILDNVQSQGDGRAAPAAAPGWTPPPPGPAHTPGGPPPPGTGWAPEAPVGHGGLPPLPGQQRADAPQPAPYGAPPQAQPEDPLQRQMREHAGRDDSIGTGRRNRAVKPYDRGKAVRRQTRKERRRDRSTRQRKRSGWLTTLMFLAVFGGVFYTLYIFRAEIGARFPDMAPYIEQYATTLDSWSSGIGGYFSELWGDLFDKIEGG